MYLMLSVHRDIGENMVLRNLKKRFEASILPEETESNIKQTLKHILLKCLKNFITTVINMIQLANESYVSNFGLVLKLFDHHCLKAVHTEKAKGVQMVLVMVIQRSFWSEWVSLRVP